MQCPFCKDWKTEVRDSRPVKERGFIRRRRYCSSCTQTFTTYEVDAVKFEATIESLARPEKISLQLMKLATRLRKMRL